MTANEGYGRDFTAFDALTAEMKARAVEKFGSVKYQNWCPFRSPKGTWMAFHNSAYSDIRVVNLDTMSVVVDGDFYAHFDKEDKTKTVYGSHVNSSTYVPSYASTIEQTESGTNREFIYDRDDHDFEAEPLDIIMSVPLAFNAWTIWAADYEFYVDVLDLSKIDEGIVTRLDVGKPLVIPIGAEHVRNYVNPSSEHWHRLGDKTTGTPGGMREEVTFQAEMLTEVFVGRMDAVGRRALHDIYTEGSPDFPAAKRPWEALRDRCASRDAK